MTKARLFVALSAVLFWSAGCGSVGTSGDDEADGPAEGTEGGADGDAGPDADADVGPDADADAPAEGETDGVADGDATDTPVGECSAAAECVTLHGAAPCGAWECNAGSCEVNCPGCTDADRDGYGTGAAGVCAGPDCDDADDAVFDSAAASCYSGTTGTAGVGTCLAGLRTCTAGAWGPCVGEVVPSGEACNLEDDDCDGSTDEDLGSFTCGVGACTTTVAACTAGVVGVCVPGLSSTTSDPCGGGDEDCDGAIDENCATCVPVSPTGDDATADGTSAHPFRTVQAAIDWAALDASRPRRVCVAAGNACNRTGTYAGDVVMADGISVYGNYETAGWTRCPGSTTILQPARAEGVLFPHSVSTGTVLDGFQIDRPTTSTTAAVTVDAATSVILSNLAILNTPAVGSSYGVNLINGAAATILSSSIGAGTGSAESIGIRSVGSTPRIIDNCQGYDAAGRCNQFCGATLDAVRGRFTPGTGTTFGILLQDSPGALVERSAICGNDADTGAGIRIVGDATGVVLRANAVNAWGGAVDSHGVWLEDCAGAAPWIVDNFVIQAAGDTVTTRVDGVRAIGDCHPVIDSNVRITGGAESGAVGANGVYCGANATAASRCVVLGNLLIEGSAFGFPPTAVGVRCDDGACMRIAHNVITGRGGVDSWGVWLGATGTFVDDNAIDGGCASNVSIGVYAEDSWARLQNNRILGGGCNVAPVAAGDTFGLDVRVAGGGNEIDVHSNTIDGGGLPGTCDSTGVRLDVATPAPTAGVGIFRNNIIRSGVCSTKLDFAEADAAADPRVFQNNDLDPSGSPTALYVDEATTGLTTFGAVDALTDMTVGGTISADPLFVAFPTDLHISPGSPCDGFGTPVGAPAYDMDGDPRSATAPDIGADEI